MFHYSVSVHVIFLLGVCFLFFFLEMASSSLFSEEQFLCPICLDVFTRPVSTPCGHNFCLSCITSYWNAIPVSKCPVCTESFDRRPDLKVNTFISELASQFKELRVMGAHGQKEDEQQISYASSVMCHVCEDKDAIKSCLECQMSYCGVHLEPHKHYPELQRHTLLQPIESFENSVCSLHKRLLLLFCRDDDVVLCDLCASSLHRKHDLISVEREYTDKLRELGTAQAKAEQMIQERVQKVQNVRQSMAQSQTESKDLIANSTQDFTELVSELKKNQAELIRVVEERKNMVEEEAKLFISDMEREISELQEAATKLRELKSTKDQAYFLRRYPNSSVLPPTLDLSSFKYNRHREFQFMSKLFQKSLSQLQALLGKLSTEINKISSGKNLSNNATLTYMQQFEVCITLDPSTAHPQLSISSDRKQVKYNIGADFWGEQIETPSMFTEQLAVLGDQGFASCKFYFEVFVGQKTEWCLGVATASIPRSGAMLRTHHSGLWGIWFLEDKFETFSFPEMAVHVGKVERVGVFVDCDVGEISFYDVVQATPIYSYTGCFFTEELYPYFNPCDNEYGSNLDPMVIVTASDQ